MGTEQDQEQIADARRKFLKTCGRFAVVTPPAVTLMLSSAKQNFAVAASHGNNGFGNGGDDGVPGASSFPDQNR